MNKCVYLHFICLINFSFELKEQKICIKFIDTIILVDKTNDISSCLNANMNPITTSKILHNNRFEYRSNSSHLFLCFCFILVVR